MGVRKTSPGDRVGVEVGANGEQLRCRWAYLAGPVQFIRHGATARKFRPCRWLGPARAGGHAEQACHGKGLGQPEQVQSGHPAQRPWPVAVGHPYRQQLPLTTARIGRPGSLPFRPAVDRFQVIGRHHRNRAGSLLHAVSHARYPLTARLEIPRLDQHPVPVFLQHPLDPLRPRAIRQRIGDKEVRCKFARHARTIPHYPAGYAAPRAGDLRTSGESPQ